MIHNSMEPLNHNTEYSFQKETMTFAIGGVLVTTGGVGMITAESVLVVLSGSSLSQYPMDIVVLVASIICTLVGAVLLLMSRLRVTSGKMKASMVMAIIGSVCAGFVMGFSAYVLFTIITAAKTNRSEKFAEACGFIGMQIASAIICMVGVSISHKFAKQAILKLG